MTNPLTPSRRRFIHSMAAVSTALWAPGAFAEQLVRTLADRGIVKDDRVGIAMLNCPAWIVSYMAVLKAGGIACLLNGWWQSHEMAHALEMVSPVLTIADAPRAARMAEVCGTCEIVTLEADRPGRCGIGVERVAIAGEAIEQGLLRQGRNRD